MKRLPQWMRGLGNTADGLFVVNSSQQITFWNKGAEKLLGHAEAEVLGKRCYDVIAGRSCSGKAWCYSGCAVQRTVRKEKTQANFDLLVRGKQGRETCANVSIIHLSRQGRPHTVHLMRDVTRREWERQAMHGILGLLKKSHASLTEMPKGGRVEDSTPPPARTLPRLTGREVEILSLVAAGSSTEAIAKNLSVSPYTVRNHIRKSLEKLGLHSRAQAVSYAYKNGLV